MIERAANPAEAAAQLSTIRSSMPIRIMDFEIEPDLVKQALPEVFPCLRGFHDAALP